MRLEYPAIFYPNHEQEGYTVVVPDLLGCITSGNTLVNSIDMAVDAAAGWIMTELEDGNPIPAATPVEAITPDEPDGFVNPISFELFFKATPIHSWSNSGTHPTFQYV